MRDPSAGVLVVSCLIAVGTAVSEARADGELGGAMPVSGVERTDVIALTFDVGADIEAAVRVADALDAHDIPGAFFFELALLEGEHERRTSVLLRRLCAERTQPRPKGDFVAPRPTLPTRCLNHPLAIGCR